MRWSGQVVGSEDASALPGLGSLKGLVRTVQTPEFAGITFHEVVAKSALNHVPGSTSALPFAWTINPYRGCSHACTFCLGPETLILAGDGTQVPLWSLRVGDEIYGTEESGASRRYARTTVTAWWQTRKRAYRVELADGTEIIASGDHRFLTDRGWTFVQGAMTGSGTRPFLTLNDRMMGFGTAGLIAEQQPPYSDEDYRRGYLAGLFDAEGSSQLFARTGPAISRTQDIAGRAVTTVGDLRVVAVEDLGFETDMIDISTGTGDFVANGVVSHNCFARNTHTYLDFDAGRDFDSEIVVKVNVAEVLAKELARPSWQRHPVALGTNTDPYQRAEGRYRLMPGIIAALAAADTPFSILTKGTLLRRDIPLLQAAAERVPVEFAMTIDVFDPALRESVEPGAPTTEARLATVRALRDAGLPCSVFVMPVLPYLTDTVEHLDRAFAAIAEAGADSVAYSALHLRTGAREWFFSWLAREQPDLLGRYGQLYPGRQAYAPAEYRKWLAARVRPLLRKHGLERPPRIDPATGSPLPRIIGGSRARAGVGDRMLAQELPSAAAAGLQPTLF